jgi:outer membrane biosynthesis protein TonB
MNPRILLAILLTASFAAHAQNAEPAKPAVKKSRGATSLTNFLPKVKSALALRWQAELAPHMADFAVGSTSVIFTLDAEGKVTDFKVTANSSNEAFAKFCEQFVRGTKFEKPPAFALTDGLLEIPFTFTIL